MKKKVLFSLLLTFVIYSFINIHAMAATGDVVGNIYSTDIKACINGVWVDSYNIGGKTAVIVEDITDQFAYADDIRTLAIWDFAPEHLVGGEKKPLIKSGEVVGKIYETDIKTMFRGKQLEAYSLNGKMAVVIEGLGDDNTFSDIGGRYVWNGENRTICLEMIYRYTFEVHDMLREKTVNMVIEEKDGMLTAEFVPVAITNGSILGGGVRPDNSITPVFYNGEIIGYQCKFPNMQLYHGENGKYTLVEEEYQEGVDYYYVDKIAEIINTFKPVTPTAQQWVTYYEQNMYNIKQKFETEDYMFLYMSLPTMHGATQFLTKIDKSTGEPSHYNGNFKSVSLYGQLFFENVSIDEENEKVYLHYDVDYVIDLKTDKVTALSKEIN